MTSKYESPLSSRYASEYMLSLFSSDTRYITGGDKNNLKRDYPKKADKKPPKVCPHKPLVFYSANLV